ncbi:MAG TPA: FAD-binding oxidoreductase, partial [Gemmatimonadetes bacterium]|nr:FAD-binding oxidoreductase [Gemmatimonadota bacterium]
ADRLVAYESDGLTAYRVVPRAVVLPETTDQVSEVLRVMHDEGIDVVPRGAGTGLSGGALPTPDGVIVGTARMNRILSINEQNRLARVQTGVVNA